MTEQKAKCRCEVCKKVAMWYEGHQNCNITSGEGRFEQVHASYHWICNECFKAEIEKVCDKIGGTYACSQ